MSDQEQTALVMELAKSFMQEMFDTEPDWQKAYYRFSVREYEDFIRSGSSASYVSHGEVTLLGGPEHREFFNYMNDMARELLRLFEKDQAVLLLTIGSNFTYEIQFEYQDLERWQINKMDGRTGIPEGI